MKPRTLLVLTLVSLIFVSSCGDPATTAVVIFVDGSNSTSAKAKVTTGEMENPRDGYREPLRAIVSQLGPSTTVRGGLITGHSLRVTTLPIAADFPPYRVLWDNQTVYRSALLRKKQQLLEQFELTALAPSGSERTCIADATLLAQQLFESARAKQKVLVIFSDMIEDCGELRLDRVAAEERPAKNDEAIARLISKLESEQKIPNLKGVVVCIYGATGGTLIDDNSTRFIFIRNFWRAFFLKAGADLKYYGTFAGYPFASDSAANVELPK